MYYITLTSLTYSDPPASAPDYCGCYMYAPPYPESLPNYLLLIWSQTLIMGLLNPGLWWGLMDKPFFFFFSIAVTTFAILTLSQVWNSLLNNVCIVVPQPFKPFPSCRTAALSSEQLPVPLRLLPWQPSSYFLFLRAGKPILKLYFHPSGLELTKNSSAF